MASPVLVDEPAPTIAAVFEQCLKHYHSLYVALQRENCAVVQLNQLRASTTERLLDDYGRLKVWGQQTKAWMPPSASWSATTLDYTLRHDPELRRNILETVQELEIQLRSGKNEDVQSLNMGFFFLIMNL